MCRRSASAPTAGCSIRGSVTCTSTSSATRTPRASTALMLRAIPTAIRRRTSRWRRSRRTPRADSVSWCSTASTSSSSATTSTRLTGRPAAAALASYQKGEEGLSGAEKEAWHKRATDSGVKFAQTFPEHPDSAGVLTRAAEEIFAAGDRPRAISVSESILARQPPVDLAKQRIAWTIIAQSHFDQGEYDKAEPAFLQARALAGKDDKLRTDLTERLAASVYKEGEAKQKAGDAGSARR